MMRMSWWQSELASNRRDAFPFYPWVNEHSGRVSSGTGGKAQPFPICSCRPVWGARFLSGLRSRRRRLWQGGFVRTRFRILNVTHIMVNGLARTSTCSYAHMHAQAHTHEPADPWRWLGIIDFFTMETFAFSHHPYMLEGFGGSDYSHLQLLQHSCKVRETSSSVATIRPTQNRECLPALF